MIERRALWSVLGLVGLAVVVTIAYRFERQLKNNSIDSMNTLSYLTLTSTAFTNSSTIPAQFTCDGADQSPPLQWSAGPTGTQSYALIVRDSDAPAKDWIHWVVVNIPPTVTSVAVGQVPTGGKEIINDFGKTAWGGPCPPSGSHRYYFEIYALDSGTLDATSYQAVLTQLNQHALAKGELMGRYQRK